MYGTPEDPGVIKSAVEQLFYAMEDTPNRRFLMLVRLRGLLLVSES